MSDFTAFRKGYILSNRRKVLFILIGALIIPFVAVLTLSSGVYHISVADTFSKFFEHLFDWNADYSMDKDNHYVWNVRLPRAIGAVIAGLGLSVGGVVMQNNMHNPLAEPYTMGQSSAAFMGATLSIISGVCIIPSVTGNTATVVNAFVFSLIPIAMILLISRFKRLSPTAMILLGIAMMYVFSSISQYLMITAPSESMSDAYAWRVGTLAKLECALGSSYLEGSSSTGALEMMACIVIPVSLAMYLLSSRFDVMYAGDSSAQTMGVRVNVLRIVSMALTSVMVAAIVSFTGTIGFIGLVGPHIARVFVGSKNKYLIPAAAVFGALFILVADMIAKVSGANGLPVGVISAMVGGPLFILILVRERKKVWC